MPLPELNTSGIDVTNTLAKVAAMKHMALQNQNLQSEIETRALTAPSLVEERESQNALRIIQEKEARQKLIMDKKKDFTQTVAAIKGHPDPITAYTALREEHPNIPDETYFLKQGKGGNPEWNKEAFNVYADANIKAMNMALDPHEGDSHYIVAANSLFDKAKPISITNPPAYKIRLVTKGGKVITDPDTQPEPVVDPIQKELSTEQHQRKMEKHAITMEGIAASREKRESEKAKKGKLKLQVTNEAGDPIQIMQDGTVRKLDKESGDWEPVTDPDEIRKLKKLGTEKTGGGNLEKLESMLNPESKGTNMKASPSKASTPKSFAEALTAYKAANPNISEDVLKAAIIKSYPGLK